MALEEKYGIEIADEDFLVSGPDEDISDPLDHQS
jgi:acyl carrier protein